MLNRKGRSPSFSILKDYFLVVLLIFFVIFKFQNKFGNVLTYFPYRLFLYISVDLI